MSPEQAGLLAKARESLDVAQLALEQIENAQMFQDLAERMLTAPGIRQADTPSAAGN